MSPDPHKLHLRKAVKAWSVEARRRRALYEAATEHRHAAMYEARVAGIPIDTIAADAGTDRSAVHRNIVKHARRNDLPLPRGAAHASKRSSAA